MKDIGVNFQGSKIEYALPKRIVYDIDSLDGFCRKDPNCVLTFYGGEPLLCSNVIKEIMDSVKARHFLIQTNGLLLDQLESEYLNRLHTILISIDGDEALTDSYRGKGTFRKVFENVRLIRDNGFKGELIARMTVMEKTDIHKQVRWLLDNDEFSFASVHWQLNAGFWNDFARRDFAKWARKSYDRGIGKLVKFWVDHMEDRGEVLRLYPFLAVAESIILNERSCRLRCGAGWINYAIQTDGHIVPCPSMWGMKDYYLGHINDTNPLELREIFLGEPCTKCDIFEVCGGRCLYANITRRWNHEEYNHVCLTVQNLISSIRQEIPRIRQLIHSGRIYKENFKFMKYNGCEIIP